jgi:hypothetical protein
VAESAAPVASDPEQTLTCRTASIRFYLPTVGSGVKKGLSSTILALAFEARALWGE